jgi:RNA polymerase sigma-70 factor (ECF subfamily)
MSNYKKDYDLKSSDPELNKNIENEFLMKEIHAAIDKLPENYKSVIILRDIQGLNYEQISNIIGVPLGTVKSRINRARLQLQVDLMDYQKE